MNDSPTTLRAVPSEDRMWLIAALRDALDGGPGVHPLGADLSTEVAHEVLDNLPYNTAVLLHTSGSTGMPKYVALSADAICASATATHERLGGPGQWLVTLPTHRIAGLQMLSRSIVADSEPVFLDGAVTPKSFVERAAQLDHERRYASLVPVQLARLIEAAGDDSQLLRALQRFDAVLIGGQAVPLELRSRAHDLGVHIVLTYGMTETAGGAVYDGVEIGDTRVRIRDGEIQLAGSALALGYPGLPELTSDRFITDNDTVWFRTGDRGELLGGVLTVTGRVDRVLISGGVNVSLDEVERVLHSVPGFAHVVAVAVPDVTWGQRVALANDGEGTLEVASDALRGALGSAAVPVHIEQFDALPRIDNGKPHLRSIIETLTRAVS